MNTLASLLLLTALTIPTPTLVLRNGGRIDVDGAVKQDNGKVIFRSAGVLFSVPTTEVDFDATRAAAASVTIVKADKGKLKVSPEERNRLLRELETKHNGVAASPEALRLPPAPMAPPDPQPNSDEEWTWRRNARAHEESVRRAKEEVQMLYDRADKLRAEIRSLVSLGYKANQFTYQTSELQQTYDAIPRAQLEVERAQRELDQFRDDARRMGILPGWLR